MPEPSAIASIWLMPAREDAAFLDAIVRDLAAQHGAPAFAPHLTVAGNVTAAPHVVAAMADIAASAAPFAQPIADIVTGPLYFRSLYARFDRSAALDDMKRAAIAAGLGGSLDDFTPHVSLLYGHPNEAAKHASAARLRATIVSRAIRFDRLALTTSGDDVPIPDWRIVAERALG